ncbi:MAG: hypothetical protein EB126_05140 [Synechococcaceae bacterium WBB_10_009]|jgi:hypothetical protein|nr:hypothetical protein [Synechococcaceae bacterium WBB_10_009]
MESDSSDPPPRTGAPSPITDGNGDTGEEPYGSNGISHSLFHTAAPLLGVLLGICSLTLPLAGVITDRRPAEAPTGLTTARQP